MTENSVQVLKKSDLAMKVAKDLRQYVGTDNKEIEQRLITALSESPSLYQKLFNKKKYQEKQENIKQELRVVARHNTQIINMHFKLYCDVLEAKADEYLEGLEMTKRARLASLFDVLKEQVVASRVESERRTDQDFARMIDDAEKLWGNRGHILEKKLASIDKQMSTVMEANEQALENLLEILKRKSTEY